jgi:predicted aspartyl protease
LKRAVLFILCFYGCYALAQQSVPFKLYKGYLMAAPCSVGGLDNLTAIIDTGTSETMLDMSIVQRLSLSTTADNATFLARDLPVRAVAIPAVRLGPLWADSLAGITADLSKLASDFGVRPDIVIGMDLLHRSSFTIDYRAHVLIFGEVASPMPHSARLIPGLRYPVVESVVQGQKLRLQVDTGFSGLLVYGDRLRSRTDLADASVIGMAQAFSAHTLPSMNVQVGGWHAYSLDVSVIRDAPTGLVDFEGLIGTRLLSTHRIAFEFKDGVLSWD